MSAMAKVNIGARLPYWRRLAWRLRWVTHPVTVFIALQVVWLAITLIWVIWFAGQQAQLAQLAKTFGPERFDSGAAVAILVVGCVLLGVLLVGTIMLFIFGQRQSNAARQQGIFVSSVTHELKSPLASLQLSVQTLQMRRTSEADQAKLMEIINADIDRLRRLIDQILVAGRLDRGLSVFEGEKELIAVEPLVDIIVQRLSYLDPNLKERLRLESPPGLAVKASRSALVLILNNLIENAVKYSPLLSPVRVVFAENANGGMTIAVEDDGMGLDAKELRRIFKMFQRSDAAVRKAIPGSGLGLYIVRSVVTTLGGKVWVESRGRDQGATFRVMLPGSESLKGGI